MRVRRGSQLTHKEVVRGEPKRRVWTIDAKDFGFAPTTVFCGDLDGSGEAPGVQLEFEHEGCPSGAAIAYSGDEAELVARALVQAASGIKPHERLRVRTRRWFREVEVQPKQAPPAAETIALSTPEVANTLLDILNDLHPKDPRRIRVAEVIEQLEIPF